MTLNVIAAILTMTGYSTNDTIVIFDRVRENMRSMRRDSMHDVINTVDQPDAGPNGHHRGHGAPVGARAVLVRRRSAARFRVHDDRRHHHRHLFERVHRRRDRQLLARASAPTPRRRARARGGDSRCAAAAAAADAQGRSLRRPSAKRAPRSDLVVTVGHRQAALLGVVQGSPSSCRFHRRLTC